MVIVLSYEISSYCHSPTVDTSIFLDICQAQVSVSFSLSVNSLKCIFTDPSFYPLQALFASPSLIAQSFCHSPSYSWLGGRHPLGMWRTTPNPPNWGRGDHHWLEGYVPFAWCAGRLPLSVWAAYLGDVHFPRDHCHTQSYIP